MSTPIKYASRLTLFLMSLSALLLLANPLPATAQENEGDAGGENASNPLAKVNNTDIRWQYLDMAVGGVNDIFIDGAFMAGDKLKVKYELHYWESDVTGSSRNNWESFVLKPIYFPKEGLLGDVKYRLAVGTDWILDLGDASKGIGRDPIRSGRFSESRSGFRTR